MKRKIKLTKSFTDHGTWNALHAAEKWLRDNGYDYGSMSYPMPTAVMKGDYYSYDLPHKWKNFTPKQCNSVDGIITGNFREGPVEVTLYNYGE